MPLVVGESVGHYKILSHLGAGGMGEVYLAQDERLRRKVALKLLFGDVTRNEDWIRRFELEAYAASALNHPNIITIYEVGQHCRSSGHRAGGSSRSRHYSPRHQA
jgi:serine/threonine protein kinase